MEEHVIKVLYHMCIQMHVIQNQFYIHIQEVIQQEEDVTQDQFTIHIHQHVVEVYMYIIQVAIVEHNYILHMVHMKIMIVLKAIELQTVFLIGIKYQL